MEQSNILLEDINCQNANIQCSNRSTGDKKKKEKETQKRKTLKTLQLAIGKHAFYKIRTVSKHLCFLGLFSASLIWLMIYITKPCL